MPSNDYLVAGYADATNGTPWEHCPTSFDEWRAGAFDTDEALAYWCGFDGGMEQIFANAQRLANRLMDPLMVGDFGRNI